MVRLKLDVSARKQEDDVELDQWGSRWGPSGCLIDFVLTAGNLNMASLSSIKATDL